MRPIKTVSAGNCRRSVRLVKRPSLTKWIGRVVLVRRRLQKAIVIAPDTQKVLPQQLSLLEPAEHMAAYEYSVLVTSLDNEVTSLVQHYRDRADCENSFDDIILKKWKS
jgi:hypothetical protein